MNIKIITHRSIITFLVWSVFSMMPAIASAQLKPFQSNSLEQIQAEHSNKPFILLLWSIECAPCRKELKLLQDFQDALTDANLILLATDNLQNQAEVQQVLTEYNLEHHNNWIFADDMPERLRYRIDPNWFGELPRAYFYDAQHKRTSKSGVLSPALLKDWIQQVKE